MLEHHGENETRVLALLDSRGWPRLSAVGEEAGQFEPQPMIDPQKVDRRRAAKGTEPIGDQLERFNKAMKCDSGS